MEDLQQAIEQALEEGKLFPDDQHAGDDGAAGGMSPEQMEELVDQLVQKLLDEGSISTRSTAEQGGGSGKARRRSQVPR